MAYPIQTRYMPMPLDAGGNHAPAQPVYGQHAPLAQPMTYTTPQGEVGTGPHAGQPVFGDPMLGRPIIPAVTPPPPGLGGRNPIVPPGNTGVVPPHLPAGPGPHMGGGMTPTGGTGIPNPVDPHGGRLGQPGQAANFNAMIHALTGANFNPAMLANGYMDSILSQDNPYLRDARMRGLEQANSRGMLNSNMAAGSAERSAIEAAQPLFNAAMGLNSQREQQGWQTGERLGTQGWQTSERLGSQQYNTSERLGTQDYQKAMQQASWNWQTGERIGTQNWQAQQSQYDRELKSKLQSDAAFQQNWLSSQDFSRQFNGALAMLPINTANQFMQTIQQYAIENPEIYTPEMISGMQNFFTQSMAQLLSQFFPNLGGAGGGSGGMNTGGNLPPQGGP